MVVKKDADGTTITNTAGLVVMDVSLERDETSGKHKLTATYGKISVGEIEGFPDFAVVGTNTVTAGEGEVKVITEAKENSSKEHQLDVTYGTAATKSYVDTKFSTAKYVAKRQPIRGKIRFFQSIFLNISAATVIDVNALKIEERIFDSV